MMKKPVFWILAGTTEGRLLAHKLSRSSAEVYVSVATEYGKVLIDPEENLHVQSKRLDKAEMVSFLHEIQPDCVIDTTHPYAEMVTEHIFDACAETQTEYLRLLRPESETNGFLTAESYTQAAEILNDTSGNVFLTCGSKEIEAFTKIKDYEERIYARVLPMREVMEKCEALGFQRSHMIYMQGPFSKGINAAMLKETGARYLVTKDSGDAGGFAEKVEAARELGISVIVIGRPPQKEGFFMEQILERLIRQYDLKPEPDSGESEQPSSNAYFPLFLSLKNKRVIVFGGGKIAGRRIETLLKFDANIQVIAPHIRETIEALSSTGRLTLRKREYCFGDCSDGDLVIAATDDRTVNRSIAEECGEKSIPVSVADNKELCTFLFPGIIKKENLVIGVTSGGEDHGKVKRAAEYMRLHIDEIIE